MDDETFSQEILRISYQYQLTEMEMKEAVVKAITISKDLKFEDISRNASYIYQNREVDVKPLSFATKKPDVYVNDVDDSDGIAQNVAHDLKLEVGSNIILTNGFGQKHGVTNTIRIIEVEK